MSTIQFTLPQEYGYVIPSLPASAKATHLLKLSTNTPSYVLLAASSTFILSFIHGLNTGSKRKAAGVAYPAPYASTEVAAKDPKAFAFNCAQRAHANYLENQPSVIAAMLVAGLQYPVATAVLGATWIVNRYIFMVGYSKPEWGAEGKGRLRGGLSWLAQLGLFGLSVAVGVNMVRA